MSCKANGVDRLKQALFVSEINVDSCVKINCKADVSIDFV